MEPREFFETLETRVDASKTAGMNNSYVFEIDGAGTWQVDVTDGSVKVTEGGTDGDVTIRADARATHQSVVTAMDVIGRLGFTQINIATINERPGG